jgi:ubiquinone/menaquinone biosynthesis C-methylase UbiE
VKIRLGTYYRWQLSEYLGLLPGKNETVLDIGSHDGYFLSLVTCQQKIAIDLTPASKQFYPVWKVDGRQLPFANASFDRIYLLDVIEHIVNYTVLLQEATRVLRPGGNLMISTPSQYWWVVPPFLTPLLDKSWGHVRRGHTVEEIEALFPDNYSISAKWWNMPYFRTFYFPSRLIWQIFPMFARSCVRWIAKRDQQAKPGKRGHLFIKIHKCLSSVSV